MRNGIVTTSRECGDANQAWLARFEEISPNSSCRHHDPAYGPVFQSGHGAILQDMDGQTWIDFTCGYSATNFGHLYPPLVEAAQGQLKQLAHLTGEPHEQRIRLAEELAELFSLRLSTPRPAASLPAIERKATKVVFNSSGARAVEAAWKAAASFRPGLLLAIAPSLHGRTIATSAISTTKQTSLSDVLASEVMVWPAEAYPHCSHCPLGKTFPQCEIACIDPLLRQLEQAPEKFSAILVEPVMTARGYIFPPAEYLRQLRRVTEKHGILMISDEIQAGLGRCGSLVQSIAQDWLPDLIVFGKSLGGGLVPISAVVGRADVLDAIPAGAESETAAASPLGCAVARRVLGLLRERSLIQAGSKAGQRLRSYMRSSTTQLPWPVCIEGQAAICVVECHTAETPLSVAQARAAQIATACTRHRVRIQLSGPQTTRVVMLPPLTIQAHELDFALERLGLAFRDVARQ